SLQEAGLLRGFCREEALGAGSGEPVLERRGGFGLFCDTLHRADEAPDAVAQAAAVEQVELAIVGEAVQQGALGHTFTVVVAEGDSGELLGSNDAGRAVAPGGSGDMGRCGASLADPARPVSSVVVALPYGVQPPQ